MTSFSALLSSKEWTAACLLPLLSIHELVALSGSSWELRQNVSAYAWRRLSRVAGAVGVATAIGGGKARSGSLLRELYFWMRLEATQRREAYGGGMLACGDRHSLVVTSSGEVLAFGATQGNLLGVPLVDIEDVGGKITAPRMAGPAAYEGSRTKVVACSREHSVALEESGRVVWVWGGKFPRVTKYTIPKELGTAVGVGAGMKSFSPVLMESGEVFVIRSHEEFSLQRHYPFLGTISRYQDIKISFEKLNICGMKAKSISASGSCFAVLSENGEVAIFTIDQEGHDLLRFSGNGVEPNHVFDEDLDAFVLNENFTRIRNLDPYYRVVPGTSVDLDPSSRLKVASIDAADRYLGMVTENGELWIVGASPLRFGMLSINTIGSNTPAILGDRNNGVNYDRYSQRVLGNLENEKVCKVSCGPLHTLALTTSGKVYSWGFNGSGRLGLGHENDVHRPTPIMLLDQTGSPYRAVGISAGYHHSALMLDNGKTLTFGGIGIDGRLGHSHYSFLSQNCLEPSPIDSCAARTLIKSELASFSESLTDSNGLLLRATILILRISLVIVHLKAAYSFFCFSSDRIQEIFEALISFYLQRTKLLKP